jgi:hypothetical protein
MASFSTLETLVTERFESFSQKLERLDGKLDKISADSRVRDEKLLAEVLENRQNIAVHSHRIEEVERGLQKSAERNGATQLDEINRLKDSKTHWIRYVIGTIVGLLVSAVFLTITLLAK